ncbi:DUF4225 domain-containing protein [Enterobacter bugandensis]|uniref:DUF4225 domain-containing protein n=1 Tax=Enterobacter bugandensis TaxID=881260 RepID=UPI0021D03383|nr:DUF4225 domain-containing protein [Enterobacter bugandensis]MCU6190268.1 DUF4225 domain-containing protein [Enterobacter bugandensis]
MDTLLLPGQNPRAWAETMINLEARKLVNTANTVAAMHLQDGFIRIQFVDEIRAFIMAQFEAARRAKTDDDCMACLQALRAENTSLIVMMSSMTPVGVVAGAVIVVNGFNTISREAAHNLFGDKQTEGIFADGSMEIAEFLGFSRQQGLGTYKAVTLFSEVYGAYGLRLKPEAQRLWYWTRPDFFRKVSGTPRPAMALKIAGWGVKAKVALDLLTIEPSGK